MEPDLAPGESGEHVTLLQERLRELGYYEGSVDGQFGQSTEDAVRRFQEAVYLEQDGHVGQRTWEAIEQQELLHGNGSHLRSHDGAQQESTEVGQLSPDGQWWWDGVDWQVVSGHADAEQGTAHDAGHQPGFAEPQLSPDGQWQWDGTEWRPADASLLGSPGHQQVGDLAVGQPDAVGGGPRDAHGSGSLHPGDLHIDPMPDPHPGQLVMPPPGPTTTSTDRELTGFATGSAELTAEHQAILNQIAVELNEYPLIGNGGFVTLNGFADRRGETEANRQLGQRRAEAVRDYLWARITDEDTKNNIRAYALGAPEDGPPGDQPSLRKVTIDITRRGLNIDLNAQPTGPNRAVDPFRPLGPNDIPPDLLQPQHRPADPAMDLRWFTDNLDSRRQDSEIIELLARYAGRQLGAHDLARLAGELAHRFGADRAQATRFVEQSIQHGLEAGLRAALNRAIRGVAGEPSEPEIGTTRPGQEGP